MGYTPKRNPKVFAVPLFLAPVLARRLWAVAQSKQVRTPPEHLVRGLVVPHVMRKVTLANAPAGGVIPPMPAPDKHGYVRMRVAFEYDEYQALRGAAAYRGFKSHTELVMDLLSRNLRKSTAEA